MRRKIGQRRKEIEETTLRSPSASEAPSISHVDGKVNDDDDDDDVDGDDDDDDDDISTGTGGDEDDDDNDNDDTDNDEVDSLLAKRSIIV